MLSFTKSVLLNFGMGEGKLSGQTIKPRRKALQKNGGAVPC